MTVCGDDIEVELPVEGHWTVLTPPGHGRWAFDLLGSDATGRHLTTAAWRVAVGVARAEQTHGWSQPVSCPVDGEVVVAHDGEADQLRLSPITDLPATFLVAPLRHRRDPTVMAGNHLIVASPDAVAFLGHLRRGSLRVRAGETVRVGQVIGEVGNSGNSVLPHLHFHIMDGLDPTTAREVPFVVRQYALWDGHHWVLRRNTSLPRDRARIRIPSRPTGHNTHSGGFPT